MNCMEFPERRIGTNENHDDIRALLHEIKPSWDKDQIQIENLSGGLSSNIFKCFAKSNPDDAVTVRVRRLLEKCNAPHASPEFETKALQELNRRGYFPPLLAVFNNGYCYEYLKGCPVKGMSGNGPIILEDHLIRLLARELANVHSVKVPETDYSRTPYFSNMAALVGNEKLPWKDEWPFQKVLVQEVDIIRDYVAAANSPLVLCHGDFHSGNTVWNEEQNRVTCVDWELAYIGHRACDIAYFINVFEYLDFIRKDPETSRSGMQLVFCQAYIERNYEIKGLKEQLVDATKDVEQLLLEVKYFKLVVLFQWLIYVVAFWETTEKLSSDTAGIVNYNIKRYLQAKEEALGISRFGK